MLITVLMGLAQGTRKRYAWFPRNARSAIQPFALDNAPRLPEWSPSLSKDVVARLGAAVVLLPSGDPGAPLPVPIWSPGAVEDAAAAFASTASSLALPPTATGSTGEMPETDRMGR